MLMHLQRMALVLLLTAIFVLPGCNTSPTDNESENEAEESTTEGLDTEGEARRKMEEHADEDSD